MAYAGTFHFKAYFENTNVFVRWILRLLTDDLKKKPVRVQTLSNC